MPVVVQRYESIHYTGDNGEEVAAWIGNLTYVRTADDGTLHVTMDGGEGWIYPIQVPPDTWLLRYDSRLEGMVSGEDYPKWYYELPGSGSDTAAEPSA
jgi:hypothetical protein